MIQCFFEARYFFLSSTASTPFHLISNFYCPFCRSASYSTVHSALSSLLMKLLSKAIRSPDNLSIFLNKAGNEILYSLARTLSMVASYPTDILVSWRVSFEGCDCALMLVRLIRFFTTEFIYIVMKITIKYYMFF